MKAPVDFVSSHNYPTGNRGDGSGCGQGATMWDPDCFYDRVTAARAKIPSDVPFFVTEYSVMVGEGMATATATATATAAQENPENGEEYAKEAGTAAERGVFRYGGHSGSSSGGGGAPGRIAEPTEDRGLLGQEPPYQHDDAGAAAFVLRVVPQLAPHLDVLSYWTFSDIFEENSIPRTEFHPIGQKYPQPHYGAMSLHGVAKPVWRAFQLLNTHAGSHTVDTTAVTHSSTAGDTAVPEVEVVQAGESCTGVAGMLYTGGDLLTAPAPIGSLADCCQLCLTTPKCNYYTYDTQSHSGAGNGHHCYLKSEPTGQQMNSSR